MVKPKQVKEKPKPYIAKCPSLNDAIMIRMNCGFGGQKTDIVEYHGKFYVVPIPSIDNEHF